MRLLFTLLSVLLLAVALGWVLQQSPGAVVFIYREWTVQTSLVVFVFIAAVLFLLAYALLRMLARVRRAPADFRAWSAYRRRRRSEKLLNQGLLAMMRGEWRSAERAFQKGAALSGSPLVNYLGAAQAAYRLGSTARAQRYLGLAQRHDDTGSPVVGLARARLHIDQHQVEQAEDTLNSLETGHEQVTLMQLETATAREDWSRATGLLRECTRRGLLPAEQARARQITCYTRLLQQAGNRQGQAGLEDTWRRVPNPLKRETPLLEAYVQQRLRLGDAGGCEALLRRALKRNWEQALIRLYGQVEGRNPKQQLEFAEDCLARYPQDAALLLTLGRLCIRNHLWGKARSYLEQCVTLQPDPVACHELASLLEERGEHAAAKTYFQQGLELATAAPDDGAPGKALAPVAAKQPLPAGRSG